MKDIAYDDAFVPSGAPSNALTYKGVWFTTIFNSSQVFIYAAFVALTVGAGVQWNEAYAAADAHGRAIVGGACPSVGAAGGWAQGGGLGILSPSVGLGISLHITTETIT